MKTDTPRPILLKDYKPPNFLIYAVDLDVALHPTHTRVRARLKVKRNPAYPGNPGPLRMRELINEAGMSMCVTESPNS